MQHYHTMMHMIAAIEWRQAKFRLPPFDTIHKEILAVRQLNLPVRPFKLGSNTSIQAFHQSIMVIKSTHLAGGELGRLHIDCREQVLE